MAESVGEVTKEGRAYAQRVAFAGGKQAEALFMGLCKAPKSGDELTLARAGDLEPKQASGYARARLGPSDWRELRADSGLVSMAATGFWRNSGQDAWPQVDVAFIATGPDGDGELLAWAQLLHSRVLVRDDELRNTFVIRF